MTYKTQLGKLLLLLFCCAAWTTSCIDEITFETERSGGQLIVDGGIYNHEGPYSLELSMTNEELALPVPISGAKIELVDGNGTREFYTESHPGVYTIPGNLIKGERGETYHIEMTIPDGRKFRSIPETMPLSNGQTETIVEATAEQEPSASGRLRDVPAVNIYTNTQLPDSNDELFFKWDVQSVFSFRENEPTHPLGPQPKTCYVTQSTDPQVVSLLSTDQVETDFIQNKLLVSKRVKALEFYRRHVFSVILSSITERRYNYWSQVDQMINQTGTIFDAPPATVRGNLYNVDDENEIIFGYFEAAVKDTSHSFVTKQDFRIYIPNPCPAHEACNNCLILDNSSLERPHYF